MDVPPKIFSAIPVSYTHLDVYKRQGLPKLVAGIHFGAEDRPLTPMNHLNHTKQLLGHRSSGNPLKEPDQHIGSCLLYTSSLLKIATPTPFPEKLGLEFLNGVTDVLCLEELDPVIETNLLPVSYTHLDVYKRQGLRFHLRRNGTKQLPSLLL